MRLIIPAAILILLMAMVLGKPAHAQQPSFWQKVEGPTGSCRAIAIDPANRIYVQTQDRMYRSMNNGAAWSSDCAEVPGGAAALFTDGSSALFAAGHEIGGMYRSIDNGTTWSAAGLDGVVASSTAISPSGSLFVGTDASGLLYSDDNGANWVPIFEDVDAGRINAVILGRSGDVLFGTETGSVFRSTDGGESWKPASSGLPESAVVDMVVDRRDRVYAATRNKGVFLSEDHGATWQLAGLAKSTLGTMSVGLDNVVYVTVSAPEPGLMRSVDVGKTWEEVITGLGSAVVQEIAFDTQGNMFAATSKGIYRSNGSISAVGANDPVAGFSTRLYPNPVSTPRTTLEVELGNAGETSVTLVSNDGRTVATPFAGWLPAGASRIELDCAGLAAGSYLCSIRTGNSVQSQTLVVAE